MQIHHEETEIHSHETQGSVLRDPVFLNKFKILSDNFVIFYKGLNQYEIEECENHILMLCSNLLILDPKNPKIMLNSYYKPN